MKATLDTFVKPKGKRNLHSYAACAYAIETRAATTAQVKRLLFLWRLSTNPPALEWTGFPSESGSLVLLRKGRRIHITLTLRLPILRRILIDNLLESRKGAEALVALEMLAW